MTCKGHFIEQLKQQQQKKKIINLFIKIFKQWHDNKAQSSSGLVTTSDQPDTHTISAAFSRPHAIRNNPPSRLLITLILILIIARSTHILLLLIIG